MNLIFLVKTLTTNVEANINGIQIPWIGVDGGSACNSIFDENDEKVSCPLKAGQRYTYKNRFDVLAVYPTIQTIVHWSLKAGKTDVTCFEVPVRIV
jgi:Niemann-Pick C2 protein